jgi:hypothetical protein
MNYNSLCRVFEIVSASRADPDDDCPIAAADHDVVYLNINGKDVPVDSVTGKELDALGAFYDESDDVWILMV